MPRADKYIAGLFPPRANKTTVRARALTPLEAANLAAALQADAADLYYTGWVSFLDALNGMKKGFYTWATVKLYYSVFYAFRASLALNNVCIFHVSRPHYIVDAQPGHTPASCIEPGTHRLVLKTFQQRNPTHLLMSQQIDLEDAIDWLIDKRESANYGNARFSEPDTRRELDFIIENGIRETLSVYLTEETSMYVFDPDHAMVAYPLRALQSVGDQLVTAIPSGVTVNEQLFLKACARDAAGPLASLLSEMKRLTLVT
jgi:hypothetical protein